MGPRADPGPIAKCAGSTVSRLDLMAVSCFSKRRYPGSLIPALLRARLLRFLASVAEAVVERRDSTS